MKVRFSEEVAAFRNAVLAGTIFTSLAGAASLICRGPEVSVSGGRVTIAFSVSVPKYVEVAILDTSGRVVRHLAAGVLGGENPPPAPLRPGLSQSIVWDGKGDKGTRATGGPFSVRVRAGFKPELEGLLLYNPNATGPISHVAVGGDGTVFVFHHDPTALPDHWGSKKIKAFTRDGRYLRTVVPPPADMEPKKLGDLRVFRTEDGRIIPRIHHLRHLSFYPSPAEKLSRCSSPVVDPEGRIWWMVLGPRLACLNADGSVPWGSLLGPPLLRDVPNVRMANHYLYDSAGPRHRPNPLWRDHVVHATTPGCAEPG